MNKLLLLFIISISLFAQYEKGYIDTHGGRETSLVNKKIDFSKEPIKNLYSKKDVNKSEIQDIIKFLNF